jgi:hypothetical protein
MAKKAKKEAPYPPYAVAFKVGDKKLRKERGTHSFDLPPLAPGVTVRVFLTQEDPGGPNAPNLLFTIKATADKSTKSKKKQ